MPQNPKEHLQKTYNQISNLTLRNFAKKPSERFA